MYSRNAIAGLTPQNRSAIIALGWGGRFASGIGVGERILKEEVAANIAQFRHGNGKIVVTTFRLLGPFLEEPVATIMLHDLVEYCYGSFQPVSLIASVSLDST